MENCVNFNIYSILNKCENKIQTTSKICLFAHFFNLFTFWILLNLENQQQHPHQNLPLLQNLLGSQFVEENQDKIEIPANQFIQLKKYM